MRSDKKVQQAPQLTNAQKEALAATEDALKRIETASATFQRFWKAETAASTAAYFAAPTSRLVHSVQDMRSIHTNLALFFDCLVCCLLWLARKRT